MPEVEDELECVPAETVPAATGFEELAGETPGFGYGQ